jgi:outer membrane protein assembly factor BamB
VSEPFDTDVGIRHIALTRANEDIFATAHSEKEVTVWSFKTRRRLSTFSTILDFGGPRLGLSYAGWPMVIAGSWTRGVVAYHGSNGEIQWSRPDLRNVQQVRDFSDGSSSIVGVGLDQGPFHILNVETGQNHSELASIKEIYPSPFGSLYLLLSLDKAVHLSVELRLPAIWKRPLVSFAILDAAFSPGQVAYSEAGGSVYCFDLYGTEIWRFRPEQGHHVMQLAWDWDGQRWLAVNWPYQLGGPKLLLEIDTKGNSRVVASLGHSLEVEFFPSGKYLITSSGEVVSTQSGESVWKFYTDEFSALKGS